jgi:acyl-coenzyme A thioesterase PaaI-like protein
MATGTAVARLSTRPEMAADDRGLVHGGFAFGLADYAAMLAVNDPYVVLGAAEARFLAPVRVGDVLTAKAVVESAEGKKRIVKCLVSTDREVLAATFTCFVLPRHVLDL